MPPEEAAFRVAYSEAVRAQIRELLERLHGQGYSRQWLAWALERIDTRLRREPMEFGEPYRRLQHSGMILSVGFVRPLAVRFGIVESLRVVFVREMFAVKGPPAE